MNSTTTSASTAGSARSRPRILAFLALSALFVAAALWKPLDRGVPLCGFKLATGISCPGCGMTRALAALAKGDMARSVAYHAFAPVVAIGAAAAWMALGIGFVTGRNLMPDLNAHRVTFALLGFIALLLAYWFVRLWRGSAP
jgi:hypothetical protein